MIKSEDIDRLYEMLKVWAKGKSFTHTELLNFTSTMVRSVFPGENISKNITASMWIRALFSMYR